MNLSFEDITVQYGSVHALSGVSLGVNAGEVGVLVGPNGAGKSTLMGVLLGLIRPNSGQIVVEQQVVANATVATTQSFREQLGYLPESVAFSENLTGRQVLGFFARARAVSGQRLQTVLARIGLAPAADRSVGGYSRGMRQRLGLGVAILHEPAVLVLDEPTGGLDQHGLSVLWEVLTEWREAGRIVLLSTHELALIERRADRMFVLVNGKIKAAGTPDELRARSSLEKTVRVGPGLDEIYEELIGEVSWDASHVR